MIMDCFYNTDTILLLNKMLNERRLTLLIITMPSWACYAASLGVFGLFFTSSWFGKSALEKIPLYNIKYQEKNKD